MNNTFELTLHQKLKSADPTKEIDLTNIPAERIRNFSIIAHIGIVIFVKALNITRHCNQAFFQQTMEKAHLLTGQYHCIESFRLACQSSTNIVSLSSLLHTTDCWN